MGSSNLEFFLSQKTCSCQAMVPLSHIKMFRNTSNFEMLDEMENGEYALAFYYKTA